MSWLVGWRYRRPLYANTSALTDDCADFPAALYLPDLTGQVQPDFADLVVTASDGHTRLDSCWEVRDPAAGVGHCKLPRLPAGHGKLLVGYLYYGHPGASEGSEEAGTFSAYHRRFALCETSGPLHDSLGLHHATPHGDPTYGVAGRIGPGLRLEGTDDYFYSEKITLEQLLTGALSLWVKPEVAALQRLWSQANPYFNIRLQNSGRGWNRVNVDIESVTPRVRWYTVTDFAPGQWLHVVFVGQTPPDCQVYVNGVCQSLVTGNYTGSELGAGLVCGARRVTLSELLVGTVDEARIMFTCPSASWVLAEYLSGTNQLLSWGEQETAERWGPTQFCNLTPELTFTQTGRTEYRSLTPATVWTARLK